MFKHILIPTDGSDLSRKAILYGVQLAKEAGADVTGLTVAEPYHAANMDTVLISRRRGGLRGAVAPPVREGDGACEVGGRRAGVKCETIREVHDQPYRAIIDAAHARGCDLIVMASHGRRGSLGAIARQRNGEGAERTRPFRCWSTADGEPPTRAGSVHPLDAQERPVLDGNHSRLGAGRAVRAGDAPGTVTDPDAPIASRDRFVQEEVGPDHRMRAALRQRPGPLVERSVDPSSNKNQRRHQNGEQNELRDGAHR